MKDRYYMTTHRTMSERSYHGATSRSFVFQVNKRESIAFSIGFSPLQSKSSRPLKRQTAFIQKQADEKKSKVSNLIQMFEHKQNRHIATPLKTFKKMAAAIVRLSTPHRNRIVPVTCSPL